VVIVAKVGRLYVVQGHVDLDRQIPASLDSLDPHLPLNAADRIVVGRKSIELGISGACPVTIRASDDATSVPRTIHRISSTNKHLIAGVFAAKQHTNKPKYTQRLLLRKSRAPADVRCRQCTLSGAGQILE